MSFSISAMKPYKPSNIVPSEAPKNLTLVAIATGIITGGVVGFISQFFYLIILFPLVMGGAAGFAISVAVKGNKVRNPTLAAGFATLTGLLMYATMNYAGYIKFKQDVRQEIITATGKSDDATINQLTDDLLKEETQDTGFIGYVKYTAKQGISISKAGSSGKNALKLDETATWIYFLAELLLINGLAIFLASGAASEPFCEDGNDWYGDKAYKGSVKIDDNDQFLELLKSENYAKAAALVIFDPEIAMPRLDLFVQTCANSPLSNFVLTVAKTSLDHKKNIDMVDLTLGLITHRNHLDLFPQPQKPQAHTQQQEPQPEEQSEAITVTEENPLSED
jgi:hypothetical protein